MRVLYQLILFAICDPLHSLKLLAAGDDDSSIDLAASNLPEEWEADITFSYKPLEGKCKEAGDFKLWSKDGVGCTEKCVGSAHDVKKWCTVTKKEKFNEVIVVWISWAKTASWIARNLAKLYSMANEEKECKKAPVTAFDFKATGGQKNWAPRAFKGSDGGKPVTTAKAEGFVCYTKAGITWIKNDPKVKNMDGEEFEIMATGTFSLLSLKEIASQTTTLQVLSTIDRAGSRCGATYIQNITLQGEWIQTVSKTPQIQIRAHPSVPKSEALQVKFDDKWKLANSKWTRKEVQLASATKFTLKVHQISIQVSTDSHRIHESGFKTRRFANFLNVNFGGISSLSGVSIGGLLGRDSYKEAATAPAECDPQSLLRDDASNQKMLSQINCEQ